MEIFSKCLFDIRQDMEVSSEIMNNYDKNYVKCKSD